MYSTTVMYSNIYSTVQDFTVDWLKNDLPEDKHCLSDGVYESVGVRSNIR